MERTFHMLLYRTSHAQKNYLRPYLKEIGLGTGQPKLLTYLATKSPCRQKELADYFEVDRAAISRMLHSMEKNGFITHETDRNNRRADSVRITKKGREANQAWHMHCQEVETKMLSGFTDKERRQFADYLFRAYLNMRAKD